MERSRQTGAGPDEQLRLDRATCVLEARFYPFRKGDQRYVVAGWVVFDGDYPLVLPAPRAGYRAADVDVGSDPAALVLKLRYLVDAAGAAPLTALQSLRSNFWSFVVVPDGAPDGRST